MMKDFDNVLRGNLRSKEVKFSNDDEEKEVKK